ncbi:MAG: hypothetical protein ACTHMT_14010 [Verrucomicrobiota bacterium]
MKDEAIRPRSMLKRDASLTEVMLFEAKLWIQKQETQRQANTLKNDGERIQFYLSQLSTMWGRVIQFQRAIGLEASYFNPFKDFLKIFALTSQLEKLVSTGHFTFIDMTENWELYLSCVRSLGHDLNPFDFNDRSMRCFSYIEQLNGCRAEQETIPLEDRDLARLAGFAESGMRLQTKN